MKEADVVMVVGARLNWMLSFGRGKWNPAMKFIQLDVAPEEIDVNVPIAAPWWATSASHSTQSSPP